MTEELETFDINAAVWGVLSDDTKALQGTVGFQLKIKM